MLYTYNRIYTYTYVYVYMYMTQWVCKTPCKEYHSWKKTIKLYPYRYMYMYTNAQKMVWKATLQNDNSNYL